MAKKFERNIDIHKSQVPASILVVALLGIWELLVHTGILSRAVLPSPTNIISAIPSTVSSLFEFLPQTLYVAGLGLAISTAIAFTVAILMDRFDLIARDVKPLLIITQAIPTFAVAPIFVIWFGFGVMPKVIVVTLICTFPMLIGL